MTVVIMGIAVIIYSLRVTCQMRKHAHYPKANPNLHLLYELNAYKYDRDYDYDYDFNNKVYVVEKCGKETFTF